VGAACALAAVEGGWLNVMINLGGLKNKKVAESFRNEADGLLEKARVLKEKVFGIVIEKIGN